jgi:hypothetical protein
MFLASLLLPAARSVSLSGSVDPIDIWITDDSSGTVPLTVDGFRITLQSDWMVAESSGPSLQICTSSYSSSPCLRASVGIETSEDSPQVCFRLEIALYCQHSSCSGFLYNVSFDAGIRLGPGGYTRIDAGTEFPRDDLRDGFRVSGHPSLPPFGVWVGSSRVASGPIDSGTGYWLGSNASRDSSRTAQGEALTYSGTDAAVSFSWLNRRISWSEPATLNFAVGLYNRPFLTMHTWEDGVLNVDSTYVYSGSVYHGKPNEMMSVWLWETIDDDHHLIASGLRSRDNFSFRFSLKDYKRWPLDESSMLYFIVCDSVGCEDRWSCSVYFYGRTAPRSPTPSRSLWDALPELPTQAATQTARPSQSPDRTATPVPTERGAAAVPIPDGVLRVELTNNNWYLSAGSSVIIRGNGTIYGPSGESVTEVRFEPASDVMALRLTIQDTLVLRGSAVVRFSWPQPLYFLPTTRVIFVADGTGVPLISIGEDSPERSSGPHSFEIRLDVDPAPLPRPLVSGELFANCEDWREVATLSGPGAEGTQLLCKKTSIYHMSLLLVPEGYVDNSPSPTIEEQALTGGDVAGIALGSIVGVVAAVAIGVFVFLRLKRPPEHEASLGADADPAVGK